MPEEAANPQELFVTLLTRHEPQVRAYIRACLPDPLETAEVMQNVSLVGWRKFPEQDQTTIQRGFGAWLCVIARYEILKFRRTRARDRLVLDDSHIERLSSAASNIATANATDKTEHHLNALQTCLDKLPADRKSLLLRSYSQGVSIKSIAKELGKSPDALYQLLRRLRIELANCIERADPNPKGASA